MKLNKRQKTLQETLSSLDGVLAALSAYPNLEDALLFKAQSEANKYLGQLFPTQLDFGKEILEHLVGMDVLIGIVSKFLTVALPGVEIGLKTALLANMQNLGTNCAINPIIFEKAIKEGIIFDLKQIDLIDKLTISPLDKKIGKYYYFGINDCETAYDVLQSAIDPNNQTEKRKKHWAEGREDGKKQKEGTSYLNRALNDSVHHYFNGRKRDFDCLLWYMKNKGAYREVWDKRTTESESLFNGDGKPQEWINRFGSKRTCYYMITDENKIKFYTKKGSNVTPPSDSGNLEMMDETTEYVFMEAKKYYVYKFGKAPIKKLSRKKYYVEKGETLSKVYFWDNTSNQWNIKNPIPTKYKSVDDLDKSLTAGDCVCIDNSYYIITEISFKTKSKKDKDGKKNDVEYPEVKLEECIDITNDLQNDVAIFVDYDLDNNKEKIEKNIEVSSSFSHLCINKGQRQWYKEEYKDKDTSTKEVNNSNCFYEKKSSTDGSFDINVDKILIDPYFKKTNEDGEVKAKKCINVSPLLSSRNKYKRKFGILTLEFSPRTGNILQSDGTPMHQQTPYDNVLHVFYGNVKELPTSERDVLQTECKQTAEVNKLGCQVYDKMVQIQKKHIQLWKSKLNKWKNDNNNYELSENFYKASKGYSMMIMGDNTNVKTLLNSKSPLYNDVNGIETKLTKAKELIEKYYGSKIKKGNDNGEFNYETYKSFFDKVMQDVLCDGKEQYFSIYAYAQRVSELMEANENLLYISARDLQYPKAEQNYYYRKTLFQFNCDYINSLQLFDPKVLAAQMITSLFGGTIMEASIGATVSWKTELIRDVVRDMVEKTIAAEDFAVSDCFFTFTNDSYNGMLRATELRQAGLYSAHGEENGNKPINSAELLEGLNGIDEAADQAGQIEVIKGAIQTAVTEVCTDIYNQNEKAVSKVDYYWQKSFIQTLMINLCTQLVMAMLSPKVYLLILMNLEMFGLTTNFDIRSFIERFNYLIRSIVKGVVDQFMQFLVQEILTIIEGLVQKLIEKLAFEQAEMYMRLLKQIWLHVQMFTQCGGEVSWTQDYVNFADIASAENQEPINEC